MVAKTIPSRRAASPTEADHDATHRFRPLANLGHEMRPARTRSVPFRLQHRPAGRCIDQNGHQTGRCGDGGDGLAADHSEPPACGSSRTVVSSRAEIARAGICGVAFVVGSVGDPPSRR